MKADDLKTLLANASPSTRRLNPHLQADGAGPVAKLERSPRLQVPPTPPTEGVHQDRYVVRFVSYRHRPLDDENACTKWYTDALQQAGVIQSDHPAVCHVSVQPVTIAKGEPERVEIEVWKLI